MSDEERGDDTISSASQFDSGWVWETIEGKRMGEPLSSRVSMSRMVSASLIAIKACLTVVPMFLFGDTMSLLLRRYSAPKASAGATSIVQISDEVLMRLAPDFAYRQAGQSRALIFCTIQTEGEFQHHPAILIHEPGGWRLLDMSDESFSQSAWIYVGASADRRFIWGVTDVDVESSGWDLDIVFSGDAGKSWRHLGTVHKPNYLALLDSFAMSASGMGRVTVWLREASFPRSGRGQVAKGYYSYYSRDRGRHWSGPRYSRVRPRTFNRELVAPSYASLPGPEVGIKELMAQMEGRVPN